MQNEKEILNNIRDTILEMISKNEINYKYDLIKSVKEIDNLGFSSIDVVKIVIRLEIVFDIEIEDDSLTKLTNLNGYKEACMDALRKKEKQKQKLNNIANDLFI